MCRLYANAMVILYKALELPRIVVSEGDPVTNPLRILRDDCTLFPLPRIAGTGIPCFIALGFIAFCKYCVFYKLKVCGNPTSNVYLHHFSNSIAHFMSLYPIWVILAMFQTFSLLLCLLWGSVISDL